MKRLFVLLACLLAIPAQGQILDIIMGGTNQPAATPTFSPAAGAVANPTTVTASTSTSDGCTIYFDTSNPPVTATPTYSVTIGVTLYAQARGCAHHRDSAVGSATYTISVAILPVVIHVTVCNSSPCTIPSTTAGNSLIFETIQNGGPAGDITVVSGNASGSFTHCAACNYLGSGSSRMDLWYKTNIAGGDTSITVTSGHGLPGGNETWVYEVSHANTFVGGFTLDQATSVTITPFPSYSASADEFLIGNQAGVGCDSTDATSLPSASAWTLTHYSIGQMYAVTSSAVTYQAVCDNHNGASLTNGSTLAVFSN